MAGDWRNACGSLREPGTRTRRGKLTHVTVGLLLGVHPNDIGFVREGIKRLVKANAAKASRHQGLSSA
jgi:hypothetical protein